MDVGGPSARVDSLPVLDESDVSLIKTVDDPVPSEGDTIIWTIRVQNAGPDPAPSMTVQDDLPGGVTYLTNSRTQGSYNASTRVWNTGPLGMGAWAELQLHVQVNSGTGGQTLANVASIASSGTFDPTPDDRADTSFVVVQAARIDIEVRKDLTSASDPLPGDTVSFQIEAKNREQAVDSVIVADLLPPGLTYVGHSVTQGVYDAVAGRWTVGHLDPSQSEFLDLTATVDSGTGAQRLENIASLWYSKPPDIDPSNDVDTASVKVQSVDLSLTKNVDDPAPSEGATVTFTIEVTNAGPDEANGVEIIDALPAGVTYAGSSASSGFFEDLTGTWYVGRVQVGAPETLQIQAKVDAGTAGSTLTNKTWLAATSPEDVDPSDDAAEASVTVGYADLSVTKSASNETPYESDTLIYTIVVRNEGTHPTSGVVAVDALPAGVTHNFNTASHGSYNPVSGIWNVGSLGLGEVATLAIQVSVDPGTAGQDITNSVALVGSSEPDPNGSNDTAESTIHVRGADLTLTKTSSHASPFVGTEITYTVRVTNGGPDSAHAIVVTDVLPAKLLFVSAIATQGVYDDSTGLWSVGDVADSAMAELALKAQVRASAAGSTVRNIAAVTSVLEGDPFPGAEADTVDMSVPLVVPVEQADLGVASSVDAPNPRVGEKTTWTITLTNFGPDPASNVGVQNDFAAGLIPEGWSADRGSYDEGTGLWTIGPVAILETVTLNASTHVDPVLVGDTAAVHSYVVASDVPDPVASNDDATAFVTVQAADLHVQKWVDEPNPVSGSSVVFTIAAANAGPDSATAAVADPLPAGLTYAWHSADQGVFDAETGAWSVGGLAAGDSSTLQIGASVSAPGSTTIWNVATVTALDQADPVGANDSDSVRVDVALGGGISISATQPSSSVRPGVDGLLMSLALANSDVADHTLEGLAFTNATAGPGSPAELDGNFESLSLWRDDGDMVFESTIDSLVGQTTMTSSRASFDALAVLVPASAIAGLHVSATPAAAARDGDVLDLTIAAPTDVTMESAVPFETGFPVTAAGGSTVDGCVAAQFVAAPLPELDAEPATNSFLALDVTLPANGYAADSLRTLRISNLGTAQAVFDLSALDVWLDGGDGSFDAGAADDALLGSPGAIGSVWTLSGLAVRLPPSGRRLFVSVDVALLATPGRTIAMALKSLNGFVVDSGNDGPLDAAGPLSGVAVIQREPSQISVSASQTSAVLLPGAAPREVFRFVVKDLSVEAETLTTVTLTNTTSGPGTVAERDAEWQGLTLGRLSGADIGAGAGGPADSVLFSGGLATFTGVDAIVAGGDSAVFRVISGASLTARDSDSLDLSIASSSALVFRRPVDVVSTFPIAPSGSFPVDGMSAAQVKIGKTASTILTGEVRVPALIANLPANGYEPDVLQRFDVVNLGTAPPTSLVRVELWRDTGDGVFDPGTDLRLGDLVNTGDRWEITALSQTMPAAGVRVYVTVDVTTDASAAGQTLRFAIPTLPDQGIGVASANDGPRDTAVASTVQTISTVDRVAFSPFAIAGGSTAPGKTDVPLLALAATNRYATARSLVGLRVTNATTGSGTQAELDAEFQQVVLWADDGDGIAEGAPQDTALATSFFTGDAADFAGFSWSLAPGETRRLFVSADVSRDGAADGDALGVVILGPADPTFAEPTVLAATWPLDLGESVVVDGMVAAQIAVFEPPSATIGADDGPFLALDLGIPANGYANDQLQSITVVNAGTATSSDLAEVRLWRDGGDGSFDAGLADDTDLGLLAPFGVEWTRPSLTEALPPGRTRFFVSVKTSPTPLDSATVQFAVPVDGLDVASANDGPLDVAVTSPTTLLLSQGVLLAALAIEPSASTVGADVTVRMSVRNVHATATIDSVMASALSPTGLGQLDPVSGPTPSMLALAPGEASEFVWMFRAASSGSVRLSGGATGKESGSGLVHTSLDATSNEHQIFVQAQQVQLFAVESMPFSLSRGQTGVVPLSLTFENSEGPGGSAIRVDGLRIRLEDETGAGVVPAALLSRVLVHEGAIAYIDKTSLETTGAEIDLTFAQPLVLPSSGSGSQATVAISLDVSDSTSVPSFRVVIDDETAFAAEDATSGAPVAVDLRDPPAFPIASGLARVVAEATRLDVTDVALPDTTAGRGQPNVLALRVSLSNPDPSGLAADARVGSFSVELVDSAGATIAAPGGVIETIRVRTAALVHADRAVGVAEGPPISLSLLPLVSVPVSTAVTMDVEIDVAVAAPTGAVRLRLVGPAAFDARDANTGASLPVFFVPDPLAGPTLTVQEAPPAVVAAGTPRLPSALPVGSMDVEMMSVRLVHPGGSQAAPVRVERVDLQCRDDANQPLAPSTYVDAVRASVSSTLVGEVTSIPDQGAVALTLNSIVIAPGDSVTVDFVVDLEVTAPPSLLSFLIEATGVDVRDANLGSPVSVQPAPGQTFPFGSGLAQLIPPARQLAVGLDDAMPAVLAGDEGEVHVATFDLRNAIAPPAGSVTVDRLTVRASDRDYVPVTLGRVARAVRLVASDASIWAETTLAPEDSVATLLGASALVLDAGVAVPLELELDFVSDPSLDELRVGIAAADVGVVQPGSPILQVAVSAEDGQTFPLWTDLASFTPRSLGASYSNFPNPFAAGREGTRFAFWMPLSGRVTLKIHSISGDAVRTLLDSEPAASGLHQSAAWDGRNGNGEVVRNGVYIAELSVTWDGGGGERHLRKLAVVR